MVHEIHRISILIGLIGAAVVLCLLAEQDASAQVIPRRIDALQSVKPIETPPVSPVGQLRADIIRATNPRTGKLDARQLSRPPGPGIVGPSQSLGVGQQLIAPPGAGIAGPSQSLGGGQQTGGPPGAGIQ